MARSKTSKQWLKEHFDDEYVRRAKEAGYRSRASFKLLEIQQQDRLIQSGMTVVDLGAAPGGWSQVAAKLVGNKGQVIASDILPIDSLPGVEFLQGDFTEQAVLDSLLGLLKRPPSRPCNIGHGPQYEWNARHRSAASDVSGRISSGPSEDSVEARRGLSGEGISWRRL